MDPMHTALPTDAAIEISTRFHLAGLVRVEVLERIALPQPGARIARGVEGMRLRYVHPIATAR
jgi:hypothetical protein